VPYDLDEAIPVEELNCHTVTTIQEGEVSMEVVPGPDCVIDPTVEYNTVTWLSGHWTCSGECRQYSYEKISYGEWHYEENSEVVAWTSDGHSGGTHWNVHDQLNLVSFCS